MIVILFGIIQFLCITGILLYEFKNKSSSIFLWATLMLMFGIPHLMSSFSGDEHYSNDVLSSASVFVIVFCFLYFFTRISVGRSIQMTNRKILTYSNIQDSIIQNEDQHKFLLLVLAVDIGFKLYPLLKNAGGLLATSWALGRSYSSELSYLNSSQVTSIIFYALSGITLFYWIKKEYGLFAISALLYLGTVIITRNRMEVLPFLCAIIAIPIFKNKRISLKFVILGIIGTIIVVYFIYGLWVFRHYGSISSFIENFDLSDFLGRVTARIRANDDNGELNYRKWFYYFIDNGNHFNNFNRGHSYIRMLLVYIPTKLSFGIKPTDFAQSMGAAIGMATGGSMHPTLFGDCYANLNVFGVLLGVFWALYVTAVDAITIKQDPFEAILIYVLNSVAYVIIGRGSVYNGFVPVAYGVPIILIISYCRKHIRIRIRNSGPRFVFHKRQ